MLDSHLDILLRPGFLHESPALPGDVLEFDHDLLREVVLSEDDEPFDLPVRHHCLAAAKRRRVERGDRSLLPEVAHHYLEASVWEPAVQYHRAAGDWAREGWAFREAAELYGTAARLLQEHPDLPLPAAERAAVYFAQAEALEILGHRAEALSAHRAAQAHLQDDRVFWARIERSAAWLLSGEGRLDEAAAACERACEVFSTAGEEVDLADALRTLGMVETLRGHYEAAMAHLQRALPIFQQVGPCIGLARTYEYLALLHQQRGDSEAMLEAVQHSQAVYEELGDPPSIGHALNNTAWVLLSLGRTGEALPLLLRAVEHLEHHDVGYALPHVYHSLAVGLMDSGRLEDARFYTERGLESARRAGEARTLAELHCLMARQAMAADQPGEARSHYEDALRVSTGTNLSPQRAALCIEFGEFLLTVGDPVPAVHLCEEGLTIRRRLGLEGVAEADTALARAREAIT
jgi:tetratricopeptide (TPR) repeat protein